jgi:hypothetical protein
MRSGVYFSTVKHLLTLNEKPMPRQNFLSKASFVSANEQYTRDTILSLPAFIPSIRMLAEKKKVDTICFSYELMNGNQYFVDVSVLPLNLQYTRVSLHAAYASGQAFYEDEKLALVLHDFERAIEAALAGDLAQFKPHVPKPGNRHRLGNFLQQFRSALQYSMLRKKLS